MPTLNQAEFIERSIRSVLRQSQPRVAFVVVDGGSNDGTHAILEAYEDKLTEVVIEPGCSQSEALNIGFSKYTGKYACYLNSDDILLPGALERLVRELDQAGEKVLAVYGDRIFVDSHDLVFSAWKLPTHFSYLMRRWDYIPQEASMWKYDAMEALGGIDSGLDFALDYDLFMRFMSCGKLKHVRADIGAFRVHERSKTHLYVAGSGREEVARVLQKYDVRMFPWDRIFGRILRLYIESRSQRYVAKLHGKKLFDVCF